MPALDATDEFGASVRTFGVPSQALCAGDGIGVEDDDLIGLDAEGCAPGVTLGVGGCTYHHEGSASGGSGERAQHGVPVGMGSAPDASIGVPHAAADAELAVVEADDGVAGSLMGVDPC